MPSLFPSGHHEMQGFSSLPPTYWILPAGQTRRWVAVLKLLSLHARWNTSRASGEFLRICAFNIIFKTVLLANFICFTNFICKTLFFLLKYICE